jgi:hypothetical protein
VANPLTAFQATVQSSWKVVPGKITAGFATISFEDNLPKQMTFTLGVGASQCNQYYRALLSIAGGGNTTIDLTSFANAVGDAASSFTRVKAVRIRLLSTADDATNGSAASSITVGNNAADDWTSQGGSGGFGTAASTFVVPNGGFFEFGVPNTAGIPVDATHKIIKIANNDGAVAAKVEVMIIGGET